MTRSDSYLQRARRRAGYNHPAPAPILPLPDGGAGRPGSAYLSLRAQALPRPYLPGWTGAARRSTAAASSARTPVRILPPTGQPTAPVPSAGNTALIAAASLPLSALPDLTGLAPETGPALHTELDRVRRRQRSPLGRLHRRWQQRRHRRAWTAVVIGVPVTVLVVIALVIGPVILEGTRAYQNVFVDEVPHDAGPLLPVLNEDGTPTLAGAGGVTEPLAEWDGTEPLMMLLIGVDLRTEEESRSDTMILVWVDPVAKEAAMLPLPRDLKVIVPGFGIHKINAAYAIGEAQGVEGGGPALTVQTIEANFGIRINHFAQVNFDGFIDVVDLLGGVTLDVPYPIKDNEYPAPDLQFTRVYFPAGWQHMDGERALQYARTRHADNDAQRSIRQQQVLIALREQASIGDLIPQAASLLDTFGDSVRTDLELDQAIKLARLATEIPIEAIDQYTLLNSVIEEDPEGVYYLVPDWDAVGEVLSEFTRTTVVPPAAALDFVDYDLPIRVENGTQNPGLSIRVAEVLAANGFTQVTYAPGPNPGFNPLSTFTDTSGNVTTASLVALLIGFTPEIIDEQYVGPAGEPGTIPAGPASPRVDGSPVDPSGVGLTEASVDSADSGDSGDSIDSSDSGTSGDTGGTWVEPTPEIAGVVHRAESTGEIVIVLGDDTPDPAWYVDIAEE